MTWEQIFVTIFFPNIPFRSWCRNIPGKKSLLQYLAMLINRQVCSLYLPYLSYASSLSAGITASIVSPLTPSSGDTPPPSHSCISAYRPRPSFVKSWRAGKHHPSAGIVGPITAGVDGGGVLRWEGKMGRWINEGGREGNSLATGLDNIPTCSCCYCCSVVVKIFFSSYYVLIHR